MRQLVIGDIVKTTTEILGNSEGSEGVVYEMYELGDGPAVSVIFENGEYDGFSPNDQLKFLERVGHEPTLSDYKFESVMKLSKDFDKGVFAVVFG